MKKSLPLIAGAVIVPLLAATVAAFASSGGIAEAPSATLPTVGSSPVVAEAPVELATPPAQEVSEAVAPTSVAQPPAVLVADDPEPPVTTTTTPPGTVPPNEWQTPEPTTPPMASPIPSGGPIQMTTSWDGLHCATADAWTTQSASGLRWMCPGSGTP
jgi:hypothetical protein